MRLSGCDHIRIHVGKRSRHAFGSLRANSFSHRFRFDSLLTTSPRCLRACALQAQGVPDARPEVVLAPREPPARATVVGVRGAHVPLALPGRRGRGVECALNECPRSTAPLSRARVARGRRGLPRRMAA